MCKRKISQLCSVFTLSASALFGFAENYLKKHPVRIAIIVFVVFLVLYVFSPETSILVLVTGSFASIFVALKYRLDQANYHKDLFEKRYSVFEVVEKFLIRYKSDDLNSVDDQMVFVNAIMRKSYFLFCEDTISFIKKFRDAADVIWRNNMSSDSKLYVKNPEGAAKADAFFNELREDRLNLSKRFPELKIDTY